MEMDLSLLSPPATPPLSNPTEMLKVSTYTVANNSLNIIKFGCIAGEELRQLHYVTANIKNAVMIGSSSAAQ